MTESPETYICSTITCSEEETLRLGEIFGRLLLPGITVLLRGDLGAGKTVFVRGACRALGVSRVRSPSFTLVNEYAKNAQYATDTPPVAHADLYRLGPDGVDGLGLENYPGEGGVLFVEWPECWDRRKLRDDGIVNVSIEAESETRRRFVFSAAGAGSVGILKAFAAALDS